MLPLMLLIIFVNLLAKIWKEKIFPLFQGKNYIYIEREREREREIDIVFYSI